MCPSYENETCSECFNILDTESPDENNNCEVILFDDDEDGNPDRADLDEDDNGTSDIIAHDYNQDGEWDKFEDVSS